MSVYNVSYDLKSGLSEHLDRESESKIPEP